MQGVGAAPLDSDYPPQCVTIEAVPGHCRILGGVELVQNALPLRIAASASLLVRPHLRSKVD